MQKLKLAHDRPCCHKPKKSLKVFQNHPSPGLNEVRALNKDYIYSCERLTLINRESKFIPKNVMYCVGQSLLFCT